MAVTTRRAAAKQAKTTVNSNDQKSATVTESKSVKATVGHSNRDSLIGNNVDKIDADEESGKEESNEEESDEEKTDDSDDDDSSDDGDDDSAEEDDDLDDNDDDLDELLKKAQLSLRTQQSQTIKLG